jgi:asparagine synthase (glutamine-hydrolysing)
MIDAQRRYGGEGPSFVESRGFAAGKSTWARARSAAADDHPGDRAPLQSADGRFVVVADCRLDNPAELRRLLDLGGDSAATCDARLILEGYRRFGAGIVERLLGAFAFAVHDAERQTLFLARDLFGERPLYFASGEGVAGFASMVPGLAALPELEVEVDSARLAELVGDLWPQDRRTFFTNVERVRPGEWVLIGPAGLESALHWSPPARTLRLGSTDAYAEALRGELDAAVRRRLPRGGGAVGSHLSAGFDSSAVTSAAALELGETPLYAFTSAPAAGFAGPVPDGWVADESEGAAATARLHPNIRHLVVRAPTGDPLSDLDRAHRLAWQPMPGVMNGRWWSAINAAAEARGVSVMLTGEVGNFTLSAGLGTDQLPDFFRQGRLLRWWREARALARREYGWRTVVNASFGAWVPPRLHRALRAAWGLEEESSSRSWFVAAHRRAAVAAEESRSGFRMTPWPNSIARRVHNLRGFDFGNSRMRSLAQWRIDERDVTADRRLVDFCFSLPPEALLDRGERRPVLRRALAGRVAPQVLAARGRGYQSADWFERLEARDLLAWADAVDTPAAADAVDMTAVRRVATNWPGERVTSPTTITLYAMSLLRALSCAHFATVMREEIHALRA